MIFKLAATGISLTLYMLRMAFEDNIETIHITTSKVNQLLTLYFISDVHRRTITNSLIKKLPKKIDAILIGGDLTEGGVSLRKTEKNIQRLKNLGEVYYVFGNNDREVGEQALISILKANGVHVLQNESRLHPTKPLQICGIEDGYNGKVDLNKATHTLVEDAFTVFMTHTPAFFKRIPRGAPIDLAVAGHYHGGQIRFSKWGLQDRGSFKKYSKRYHLISNGYGTTALPFRFGAASETHLICIHRKK